MSRGISVVRRVRPDVGRQLEALILLLSKKSESLVEVTKNPVTRKELEQTDGNAEHER